MPTKNASEIKNKIVSFITQKGPSLPISIARETGLDTLFASAFLSELLGEKKIKMSNMKVGSSSIFFVQGQEPLLENFSQHLKSKEKDAFNLLKNRKVLKDSEQEPAIRVALRAIKDFAIPFKNDNDSYWKYFNVSNEEVSKMFESLLQVKVVEEKIKKPEVKEEFVKEVQTKVSEKVIPKKVVQKKKALQKKPQKNEKFLDKIKEFLSNSNVEILSIEDLEKDGLTFKVKENKEEYLIVAFNKKKITEKEIIKASKIASKIGLKCSIIFLGKMPKKTNEVITALKSINKIQEIS